jgi:hypothetical protein
MSHIEDLSNAHRIQLEIDNTKLLAQRPITPQAGIFGRFNITGLWTPDFGGPFEAYPGTNTLPIDLTALNQALWVVTASVTEVLPDGTPHVGAAVYRTWSVQLDQHGNLIRIVFDLNWNWPLPSGAMIWLGVT